MKLKAGVFYKYQEINHLNLGMCFTESEYLKNINRINSIVIVDPETNYLVFCPINSIELEKELTIEEQIKSLIENRSTKQQAIYHHVQSHPKEWFDFLKTENHWLNLYCDFKKDMNRFHIIPLDDKLYLFEYWVDNHHHNNHYNHYYHYNNNYYHYNNYDHDHYHYKKIDEQILYTQEKTYTFYEAIKLVMEEEDRKFYRKEGMDGMYIERKFETVMWNTGNTLALVEDNLNALWVEKKD